MRKLTIGGVLLLIAAFAFADEVKLTMDVELNRAAMIRPISFRADSVFVELDTTGQAWSTPAWTSWDSTYNTGVVADTWNADSGGIIVNWTAAGGTFDHYELEMDMMSTAGVWNNSWAVVDSDIASGLTTYTHEIGDTSEPRRGALRYRLFAVTAADSFSEAAISDGGDAFYNQATGVKTLFHATESYASYDTGGVTVSSELTYILPATDPGAVPPVADFTGTPTAKDLAQNIATITFEDASSGTPTGWYWQFGDPDSGHAVSQDTVYTYTADGDYEISLWATNATGADEEVKSDYIAISADTTPPDTSGGTGIWINPGAAWGDTAGGADVDEPVVLSFNMDGTPDEYVSSWSQYKAAYDGTWTPADTSTGKGWTTPSSGTWVDSVTTGLSTAQIAADTAYFKTTIRDMADTPNTIAYAERTIILSRAEAAGDDYDASKGFVHIASNIGASNLKMTIYDSGGTLRATSDAETFATGWVEFTFSTPYTLTAASDYRCGVIADGWFNITCDGASYDCYMDGQGSYATPAASFTEEGKDSDFGPLSAYITNDADVVLFGNDTIEETSFTIEVNKMASTEALYTCVTQ